MALRWTLTGKVYLVGAGPGSAKLLTLRALEVLESADVVFHDDLVSDEVLEMIPARTAVFNVGKRCGVKKITQEDIQRKMISAAQNGQTVVRLKGGDPVIFGRTREEIRALRDANIEFEIVPGITAATAAAAGAEIPLTDRDQSATLVIESNHRCGGRPSHARRTKLAGDATLVFYMPGRDLANLKQELGKRGLHENTPCLMVSQAARPKQKIVRTCLRDLSSFAALPAPSVVIVGAVASEARVDEWIMPVDATEVVDVYEAGESPVASETQPIAL